MRPLRIGLDLLPQLPHVDAQVLRVGQVVVNAAPPDPMAPFGGYKQSGNGREWGEFAFEAYLEIKAILGTSPAV